MWIFLMENFYNYCILFLSSFYNVQFSLQQISQLEKSILYTDFFFYLFVWIVFRVNFSVPFFFVKLFSNLF